MKQNNKDFESKVVFVNTIKASLAFVKIPDHSYNTELRNSNVGCHIWYGTTNMILNFFVELSKNNLNSEIIGYSHDLSIGNILSVCEDEKEYYRLLGQNDILYNYSAWTGKWVVVKIMSRLAC